MEDRLIAVIDNLVHELSSIREELKQIKWHMCQDYVNCERCAD